jgi:hypothetical protein
VTPSWREPPGAWPPLLRGLGFGRGVGPSGREIHHVFLVHAKKAMEVLLTQECQMGQGAERAIPHEHVARPQRRLYRGDAGHVVRMPGIRDNLHEEPGPRVKQGEEMRHWDPTARALPPGLAKVLLEFRGISDIEKLDPSTRKVRCPRHRPSSWVVRSKEAVVRRSNCCQTPSGNRVRA